MLPHSCHSLLWFALPLVFADVEFTSPAAGSNVPCGTIEVAWKDSGRPPVIEELSVYTLDLMVGGNDISNMLPIATFQAGGNFANGSTVSSSLQPGVAGPVDNGFFLKIISTDLNGGIIINYSDRFTITGLNGIVASQYLNAAKALNGDTQGPPRSGNVPAITSGGSISRTATPTSTKQTITVTAAAKSQATSAPANRPSSSRNDLSMGAIAGIVVGAIIVMVILTTIVAFTLRRRQKRSREEPTDFECKGIGKHPSVTTLSELSAEGRVVEAGDGQPPPEMDSNAVRAELEGDPVPSPCQDSLGTMNWDSAPLTPLTPSITGEETLLGTYDFNASPATPISRI